jgi:hypothetical protein
LTGRDVADEGDDMGSLRRALRSAAAGAGIGAIGAAVYLKVYRPWQVTWGATPEEASRPLPYDELVSDPTWNATRAVTVEARPGQIWPFLVQLGWGRAGWYGYDWADNGGRPSTWAILPEHQQLEVGKDFPMSPWTAMYCVAFEAPRFMLWRGRAEAGTRPADAAGEGSGDGRRTQRLVTGAGTWLWYLDPIDERRTRLITRMRDRYDWTSPMIVTQLLVDAFDFPFMRRVLLGIKERAERLAREEQPA